MGGGGGGGQNGDKQNKKGLHFGAVTTNEGI